MKKTLNRFALLMVLSLSLVLVNYAQMGCVREYENCIANGGTTQACGAQANICMNGPKPIPQPAPTPTPETRMEQFYKWIADFFQ